MKVPTANQLSWRYQKAKPFDFPILTSGTMILSQFAKASNVKRDQLDNYFASWKLDWKKDGTPSNLLFGSEISGKGWLPD